MNDSSVIALVINVLMFLVTFATLIYQIAKDIHNGPQS